MQLIMVPNLGLDKREMAFFDSRDGFSLAGVTATTTSLETTLRKVRAFLGEDGYLNPVSGKKADRFYLPMMRRRSNVPSVVNSPNWAYFSTLFVDESTPRAVNGFTSKETDGLLDTSYAATPNQVFALPKTLINKFTSAVSLQIKFPSITVRSGTNTPFSGVCSPHYYYPYYYQMNETTATPEKSPLTFTGLNTKDNTGELTATVAMSMVEYVGTLTTYQGRGMDMSNNYMTHDTSVGDSGLVYFKDDSFIAGEDELPVLDIAFVYMGKQGVVLNFDTLINVVPGSRPSVGLSSLNRKHDL